MKHFSFFVLLFALIGCVPAWAQNTIAVRVTGDQKPLAGATVALRIWGEKKWRDETLKTGDNGEVSFDLATPLDPKKPVGSVTVHAPGFALQTHVIDSARLEFEMKPGAIWRGIVVDEKGAPIAGAKVSVNGMQQKGANARDFLWPTGEDLQKIYSAVSGADGTFAVADVPIDGAISSFIAAPNFAGTNVLGVRASSVARVVLAPGGALAGQLLEPDEKPLAKVPVFAVSGKEPGEGAGETITDEQGKFVIDSLAPGNYAVAAYALSGVDYLVPPLKNIEVAANQTRQLPTMRAVAGIKVSGIVRDKDSKKPLEGAQISGIFGPDTSGDALNTSATTEADGRFSLRVLPGQNTFYFYQAPQFYLTNSVQQTLEIGADTPEIVFELQKQPTLIGTIVDENNRPIEAQLRLWGGPDDNINSDAQGNWSYQAESLGAIQVGGGDGENGYFEVTNNWKLPVPAPGPFRVKVRQKPWQTLSGRVVNPDGASLAGIEVKANFFFPIGDDGALGETTRTATTDAAGRYNFARIREDEDGSMARGLKVTATLDGTAFGGGGEIARDGKNWKASDIILSALNRRIEGTTAPGAQVVAAGTRGVADAQGHFVFENLPAGPIEVSAACNGSFGRALAPQDQPLKLELASVAAQPTDVEMGLEIWREVAREADAKYYARDWVLNQLANPQGDTFAALVESAQAPPTAERDWVLAAQLEKWARIKQHRRAGLAGFWPRSWKNGRPAWTRPRAPRKSKAWRAVSVRPTFGCGRGSKAPSIATTRRLGNARSAKPTRFCRRAPPIRTSAKPIFIFWPLSPSARRAGKRDKRR